MVNGDAISLIESLDPAELRQTLEDLDRQQSAIRVLLRAALARQRMSSGQASDSANRDAGKTNRKVTSIATSRRGQKPVTEQIPVENCP